MGMESLDYAAILNDLEAKKSALEAAIASLRMALGMGALGVTGEVSAGGSASMPSSSFLHGGDIPAGAFLSKSIPEAAKLYLSIKREKKTSAEIAEALKKGGMESTSKNFTQMVHSGLDRATKVTNSALVKIGRSYWGLSEWYPAAMRAAVQNAPSGGKKGKKGKKKGKKPAPATMMSEPKPAPVSAPTSAASGSASGGVEQQLMRLFQTKPASELSAKDVAYELGVRIQTVGLLLGKLVAHGKMQRTPDGLFKISLSQSAAN